MTESNFTADDVATLALSKLIASITPQPGGSTPVGLGAPRVDRRIGLGCSNGCAPGEVEWLMARSPRLALARAAGVPFDPFVFTLTTTFAATGQGTNPDIGANGRYTGRDVMIHAINVDIQQPNAFVGNVFKNMSDQAFLQTSGLQCTLKVDGVNRWANPYFSLAALPCLIAPSDPWIFTGQQGILMDFNTVTALPTAGTVVTVNLIGVVPSFGRMGDMSMIEACNSLDKRGYDTSEVRPTFGC